MVNEFLDTKGAGLIKIIIKNINLHFQSSTKNYYKVGTIYKITNFSGPFQAFLVFVNGPNFVYI